MPACRVATQELASNLMMVLAIAMSVDYNLFLLTRYREDLLAGHPVPDAVLHALLSSGYTIVVSGSTLMCCTTGLYLLPLDLIASLGLAGTISVFAAMLFNLTFVPAVLVYFPRFFAMGILGVEVEAALRNGGGRGTIQNDHGSRVGSGSDDDDVLLVLVKHQSVFSSPMSAHLSPLPCYFSPLDIEAYAHGKCFIS